MGLEEFTPMESSEGWSNSSEVSEKFKESVKRAGAGIKRTKKDEKKARKYDFMLAKFLVEIILKKKYDEILKGLFVCLDKWYATNFLMWVLSLVYLPISHAIRKETKKEMIQFSYTPKNPEEKFHDNSMDKVLRARINEWIEDMEDIISIEASSITSKRTLELLIMDDTIQDFTSNIFTFFLKELGIIISKRKSESYSDFIISELKKTLESLSFEEI